MAKVVLALDNDCDTFGVYVDGKLVYDYQLTNTDELLEAVCSALGVEFLYDNMGFGNEEDNPDCVVPITYE